MRRYSVFRQNDEPNIHIGLVNIKTTTLAQFSERRFTTNTCRHNDSYTTQSKMILFSFKIIIIEIRLYVKFIHQICKTNMSRDMTKPTKWVCTQWRLRSAWASAQSDQSLRCPHEKKLGSLATHWAYSEDSDQTGRMPRLIWVFAWCSHVVSYVMSRLIWHCGGLSYLLHFHHAYSESFPSTVCKLFDCCYTL